jgi:hypothetical protein
MRDRFAFLGGLSYTPLSVHYDLLRKAAWLAAALWKRGKVAAD